MSYRFSDGYVSPRSDGYVRFSNDGYTLFTFDGYNVAFFTNSGTGFNTAKGIMYLADRSVAPNNSPSGGGYLYSQDGDGYWHAPNGLVQSLSNTRIVREFPSDADYTAVISDYQAKIMEFTGVITLGRDIILPNISGYQWTVFNNTTGGLTVTFKVLGQVGVPVLNGKRAIIYCDGTDIVRVTPDT